MVPVSCFIVAGVRGNPRVRGGWLADRVQQAGQSVEPTDSIDARRPVAEEDPGPTYPYAVPHQGR